MPHFLLLSMSQKDTTATEILTETKTVATYNTFFGG